MILLYELDFSYVHLAFKIAPVYDATNCDFIMQHLPHFGSHRSNIFPINYIIALLTLMGLHQYVNLHHVMLYCIK